MWIVLAIGAAIVWFLIMRGAEKLGVADKPAGKTLEEKYVSVCRIAHFPPERDVPKFVSRYSNLALCSSHIIYAYSGENGQWTSKIFDFKDITSINIVRGFERGPGGVAWGALLVHCADGRDDRLRIPSDEINTFIAIYEEEQQNLAEMLATLDAARQAEETYQSGQE